MNYIACAFTGHRPSKLPWKADETSPLFLQFRETVEAKVDALAKSGVVNFFSGMAEGADLECAEIVLALRENNPAIKLHCAVPFIRQAEKWTASSREKYDAILSQADSVIYVSRSYTPYCYRDRNRLMVDFSTMLIAVYNGNTRSGTGMTVRYARKLGRELYIVDPATLRITHEDAKSVDLGQ